MILLSESYPRLGRDGLPFGERTDEGSALRS